MATKVGMQSDFGDALRDLIELDFDAVEAYNAAIERIDNSTYRAKLTEFKLDHERHIQEFTAILRAHGEEVPTGPSAKQLLTKGKVMIGKLFGGDNEVLAAMKSNEEDTNTAYERMNVHAGKWADAVLALERGMLDERKHKAWMEAVTTEKINA